MKGFPIKSSVINIVEVGSGGGSIAWLDPQNRLHVGPQSAGSTPGPVCYGHGGTEPTVTDANLVLGRLNPDHFLGGELKLDVAAARAAVERIAAPLGYAGERGLIQMADGIISIATVIMAGAIKQISVEHGLDPREFVLFCYGGGGPLHASALARELSIPTVVIPPEPGNFSAIGMLLADARLDLSKTFVGVLNDATIARLNDEFAKMEAEARASLAREFGSGEVLFERLAEMRYRGQRHNIKVPISGLRRCRGHPAGVRSRLQAPLRPCRRARDRGIPGAASLRLHAIAAAGACASAAPAGGRARGQDAAGLFRRRRRPGGGEGLRAHRARARLHGRGPGRDRGIRIDDAGLAGRSVRDRQLGEIRISIGQS